MTLDVLATLVRTALARLSGTQIYDEVADQADYQWAFGRDFRGNHCLYLVLPLKAEQLPALAAKGVLLSSEHLKELGRKRN